MRLNRLKSKLRVVEERNADCERTLYTARKGQVLIWNGCVVECILQYHSRVEDGVPIQPSWMVVFASDMLGDPYYDEYDNEPNLNFQLYTKVKL